MPPSREDLRSALERLVNLYTRHRDRYRDPSFPEAQARIDLLDPLFEGLGWDVANRSGLDPQQRDVFVERGTTFGRPDYTFRSNGEPAFFVEAKPPHAPISAGDVLQAKRYAWSTLTSP